MFSTRDPHGSVSRRSFLKSAALAGGGVLLAPGAAAARTLIASPTIGHIVLMSGLTSADRVSAAEGGTMGANEAIYNASLFGTEIGFKRATVDSADDVADAARSLSDAAIIVAHVDDRDAIFSLLSATEGAGTIIMNAGCADNALRGAECDARLFHVTASEAQRADALAQWVASQSISSIVILTSRSGRDRVDTARSSLTAAGISNIRETTAPNVQADSRTAIWITPDTATEATFDTLKTSGNMLLSPSMPPFAHGVAYGPVLWHASLFKYGATQVSDRFEKQAGQPMDGIGYANWLAAQIAGEAMAQAGSETKALRNHLRTQTRFDGRKAAPITFRPWNQQARHELYILEPAEGDASVASSIPARMPDDPDARRNALDALGTSEETSSCSL